MKSLTKLFLMGSVATTALLMTPAAYSQETSSEIRGTVAMESGQFVAGATVEVLHVPSGTKKTYTSSESGSFSGRGLRVGGPYKITVTKDGQVSTYENIFLRAGQPLTLSAVLGSASGDFEEITVTGKRTATFRRTGAGSSFSETDIAGSEGVSRDMKDVLRKNPFVNLMSDDSTQMSVAGVNPRYNGLTVDGVSQNDDFGLNGSGYPTQNAPISIDAISHLSVETAPFSASKGGFSGAQVNVVTKSGTNDFSGSIFYEYMSDGLAGSKSKEDDIELDFEQKFYGGTLGGPIIKDKLFFFVSFDRFESPQTLTWGPSGSGFTAETDANIADMNEVIRIANDVYGVDAGAFDDPLNLTDEKYLAKIDWNISDQHRASFTYQYTDGNRTANTTSRASELRLSSHWYNRADKMEMYVGHLYSDWTDSLSTSVKVGYKDLQNTQAPFGAGIADVTVTTDSGDIAFGADRFRHANRLSNEYFTIQTEANYTLGDHEISAGWEYETVKVFNIFVPDSLGRWEFDSLADFENGVASSFNYQNAFSNNPDDAAAQFKFKYNNLFIEDLWQVDDTLSVSFGLRYEHVHTNDSPSVNELFIRRYGFNNIKTLKNKDLILPRLSFNWAADDRLTVRGGIGKFSGGRPNVWISNAFSNDGVTIVRPGDYDEDAVLNNPTLTSVPSEVLSAMEPGNGNTTPVDPDFELPTEWKYSLGMDYVADFGPLGDDWNVSVDVQYTDRTRDVRWVDLARIPIGTDSTGRPLYVPFDPLDDHVPTNSFDDNGYDRWDLLLTNGEGGESTVASINIDKDWDNGISFSIGYAWQDVNNAVSGTSSTAQSNFQFDPHLDRQNPEVGTAPYEIKSRITWSFKYETEFFDDAKTTISLFGEHRTGRPFSWTLGSFRDAGFGDQTDFDDSDYYLPYIPTSANDGVSFPSWFTYDDFAALVEEAGLSEYAGQFVPRNSHTSPWVHRVDLKIKQEIPTIANHKVEVYMDMKNLLNFINSDWGREEGLPFGSNNAVLVDWAMDEDGNIEYRPPFGGLNADGPREFRARQSVWQIKFGVRYKF